MFSATGSNDEDLHYDVGVWARTKRKKIEYAERKRKEEVEW
jgi:hypothetical protein